MVGSPRPTVCGTWRKGEVEVPTRSGSTYRRRALLGGSGGDASYCG